MIRFSCSSCGVAASAPEDCAGRTTKCRNCGQSITVPRPKLANPPPSTPRDKTGLGKMISHVPTGLQTDAIAEGTPQKRPPVRSAKIPGPQKRHLANEQPEISDKDHGSSRSRSTWIAGVLLVLGAGTLLGVGLHRYLSPGPASVESGVKGGYAKVDQQIPSPEDVGLEKKAPATNLAEPSDEPTKSKGAPGKQEKPLIPPPNTESTVPQQKPNDSPTGVVDLPKTKEPVPEKEPKPGIKESPPPPKDNQPGQPKDLPKKEAPPVATTPEPFLKKEADPSPNKLAPEPKALEPLAPLVAALKSKKAEDRLRAVEKLAALGESARLASGALCQTIVADSVPAVRQSALAALEKTHPAIYKPVVTLLVEVNPEKNEEAARVLASLGEEGQAAVAIVVAHVRTAVAKFPDHFREVLSEDARALAMIGGKDRAAQKMLIDLMNFIVGEGSRERGGPVRSAAARALADLLQRNPEQARAVTPALISALRGILDANIRSQALAILASIAENQEELRNQIAQGLVPFMKLGEINAIVGLGRCGRAAQTSVPLLKQLKLHPNEAVRVAATDAVARIEEAATNAGTQSISPKITTGPQVKTPLPDAPPFSNKELAEIPVELRPLVVKLKGGLNEERLKAAEELGNMGEKAMPAARVLCEAALSSSQAVSRSALSALEKVHPDLYQSVFVLLVDAKASNHRLAIIKLGLLGEHAKPALPVIFHQIKKCREQLIAQSGGWGEESLADVTLDLMKALPKIAPEEPQAIRTMIDLAKVGLDRQIRVESSVGRLLTHTPFRFDAILLLGMLGESNPEHRGQIVPALIPFLKEASQHAKDKMENTVLAAMSQIALIGSALLKCGDDAKQALRKEVLPRLRELEFNQSDQVRRMAQALKTKIEDAP